MPSFIQGFDTEAEVIEPETGHRTLGRTVMLTDEDMQRPEVRFRILTGKLKVFRFTAESPNVHEYPVVEQSNDGTLHLEWRKPE